MTANSEKEETKRQLLSKVFDGIREIRMLWKYSKTFIRLTLMANVSYRSWYAIIHTLTDKATRLRNTSTNFSLITPTIRRFNVC